MNNNPFFNNNRSNARRFNYGHQHHSMRPPKPNFTDNFGDFSQSNLHNSTMHSSRSYLNRSFSNDHNMSMRNAGDKPSFSSLFTGVLNNSLNSTTSKPNVEPFPTESSPVTEDDGGVYLQISNLDQWYDESNLRNYLMSQLKPITPILSLTIETPSIAKIKVPSVQFAKQVVSHLHRKKMGHKRIFVSFMKDKTSAECSALRNKVAGLLKDVPMHQLPMSKFRELFQSRFKSSISILDLYRMPEVCEIIVNSNDEKSIALQPEIMRSMESEALAKTDQHSAPYCIHHFKADKNKGWAEIEIDPLPNVVMSVAQVQAMIHPLLRKHQGDVPIASLLFCLEAELNITIQSIDRGVSLEHLVSCVSGVTIKNNDYGIKILAWRDESADDLNASVKGNLNSSCGEAADNISKEVIELIKMCPKSTMMFSKFIPTYHNHFGKQCRVADYGCTKLIEMFEAMSSIVQVLGDGESRQITLTHRTQIRRFSTDVFKILRGQPNKSIQLSMLSQAYLTTYNRVFDVTDYGVCDVEDLLDGLRNNNFIMVTRKRDENDDVCIYIQKRRQTNVEIEKTSLFASEVVELLRNAPQFSIPFRKFVRSYHYYFGFQCKLSDYGFMRLAELLEALSGVVEMDQNNEENRKIFLSRKVALRIFSEQLQEVIKEMTGKPGSMAKVDDVMEAHKEKFGYQMQGASLGYETVIDALKFVPFIELNSFDNELWIVSHLENQKFRQRAMLACLAIIDIGNRVPLAKFHSVFGEKFKFNISEKTLHAMKHAVEIDMVNGVKMISCTQMMKFLIHIVNVMEQKNVMNVQEIKSIMKLNLTTTFNFGFPNVSSLIQAFSDTIVGAGESRDKSLHERSDVELNPDCPLLPSGLKKLLNMKQVQLPDEKPEMFYQPKIKPIGSLPAKMRCIQKPVPMQQPPKCQQNAGDDFLQRNLQLYGNNPFMGGGDMTMSTTMPTELISQMMQQQQQQQRFHPSNPFDDAGHSSQSLYERNLKFQHQQQMQNLKRDFYNSSGFSSGGSSCMSTSSLSAYEANLQQQYSMMAAPSSRFFNRYDPPKPDTPPSKPLWLDPVWNCDGNFFESRGSSSNNSGNNGNPDSLKAFNFHVVSPFLSFKTMFTFDNPNQSNNNNTNNQMM